MRPVIRNISPKPRSVAHKEIVADFAKWLEPDQEIRTNYTRADDLRGFRNAVSALSKSTGKTFGIETKANGSVWLQRHA